MKTKITPINEVGSHKTGELIKTTVEEINKILGFTPNVKDDPCKVKNSWGFEVDNKQCGIWDYKGSDEYGCFSTYGPNEVFVKLFGNKYVKYSI